MAGARLAVAQLAVSKEAVVQTVFSGTPVAVTVFVENPDLQPHQAAVSMRTFQLAATTKMPLGEAQPWKEIEVLAGQTVREKTLLTFPALAEPASYRVEFAEANGRPLGGVAVLWLQPAPGGTERETRTAGHSGAVCELALRVSTGWKTPPPRNCASWKAPAFCSPPPMNPPTSPSPESALAVARALALGQLPRRLRPRVLTKSPCPHPARWAACAA